MAVNFERHRNCAVAKKVLHDFRGQFPATALFRVDAPACEEVPEGMQGVFRLLLYPRHQPRSLSGQGSQDLLMVSYSAQRAG